MKRTQTTFKSITALTAALAAWTLFAVYTVNASSGPMIQAVRAMA